MFTVAPPTTADLSVFLGSPLDAEQTASATIHVVNALAAVRAYTRGNGFDPSGWLDPALKAVVIGLAARSFRNPTNDANSSAGTLRIARGLGEFSLTDRLTLDNYRRQSA